MRNLDEKYCYFFSVFVIFIVYYFDLWKSYIAYREIRKRSDGGTYNLIQIIRNTNTKSDDFFDIYYLYVYFQ